MNAELFAAQPRKVEILAGATLFKARLKNEADEFLRTIAKIAAEAPFRHMVTPGGQKISAAMTNCGNSGWISDRKGYRYAQVAPERNQPWPLMPERFRKQAIDAAREAGFPNFSPDACLINRYAIGAKMGLHQDRDEADLTQPIVSFSFGLAAAFQLGGATRKDKTQKILLEEGDVFVWGGPARLFFHGVLPIKADAARPHTLYRFNLTFRRAA
ncbi:MAG: DNA oxidative demethylase AlkB [Zoogloeaceae bacterium]|jgi:alkylated DNA repair protein (DNA oxidative demethylase)|nr:DNA oxidative demethylase AlkB [Zoogloeaceae bacterium]